MAYPTSVNDLITDSVSQSGAGTLGLTPAIAAGNLFQAVAQSLGNAAHNATNSQQQNYVTAHAATATGVVSILCTNSAASAASVGAMYGGGHGGGAVTTPGGK